MTRIARQIFPTFLAHIRVPLYRNGYALVLSSMITASLGILYWILAARIYSTETIGINSAALSVIVFLANLSQLNLMNALNRFIPRAGKATPKLVIFAYLTSSVLALITGLIFLLGLNLWAPALDFLKSNLLSSIWFILSVVSWCIFVQQDSTLTGLRQATWVPIENTIFAVAKIIFLLLLATPLPRHGVFVSWTVPVMLTIIPVNLLIFRRLIPTHIRDTQERAAIVTAPQIMHYVIGDYLGSVVWMALNNLLPLLILQRLGAEANAYFYLALTVALALYMVSQNMGLSFITEVASDPTKLELYSRRVLIQTTRLLVPLVAVLVIGAPYILRLFGRDYSEGGATLLRLFCLTALPNIITSLYLSIARVQRRTVAVFKVLTSQAFLILVFTYLLIDHYGLTAVGIAWLSSQTIIAAILSIKGDWKGSDAHSLRH